MSKYNTPVFVIQQYGELVGGKERLEINAVLWAANDADYSSIPKRLRKTSKALLSWMASKVNRYGPARAFVHWHSYQAMMRETGIGSTKTVKTHLDLLEDAGLLTIHRKAVVIGKHRSNAYRLNVPNCNDTKGNCKTISNDTKGNCKPNCNDTQESVKGTKEDIKEKIKTGKVAAYARTPDTLDKKTGERVQGKEDTSILGETGSGEPNHKGKVLTDVEQAYLSVWRKNYSRRLLTRKQKGQLAHYGDKLTALGFDPAETMEKIFSDWPNIREAIENQTELFDLPDRPQPMFMVGGINVIAEYLSNPPQRYSWEDYDKDF